MITLFGWRFRPTLWPTLLALPALLVLLGLGTWQLDRMSWKRDLLATMEDRMAQPPVMLPADIGDPTGWAYRRVALSGRYLHAHELHLASRTYRGQAGYHLLTPLVRDDLPDDAAGPRVVLIDRGWVPTGALDPATRPDSRPEGPQTVTGIAREPLPQAWMQPDNEPGNNVWFWIDLPAIAAAAGLAPADLAPLTVERDADPEGPALPVGGRTRLDLPNNHLEYAITWYSFALILMVIYILYHLRRPTDGHPRPAARLEES